MAVSSFDYKAALQACAQGDQTALKSLYDQEAPCMLALSTKMLGQHEEAEEAVRDTFVLIWKNAENYDDSTGAARAWVYSILRYRVLHQLRQTHTPVNADDDAVSARRHADGAGYLAVRVESLDHLDDSQRLPLLMAFYGGQTLDQIAARLAIPADQARAQLRTGLNAMQGLSA